MEKCSIHGSIEVTHYQKTIWDLYAIKFGYEDAVFFLLKPNLGVQLNLLGLHYCLDWLKVPVCLSLMCLLLNLVYKYMFLSLLYAIALHDTLLLQPTVEEKTDHNIIQSHVATALYIHLVIEIHNWQTTRVVKTLRRKKIAARELCVRWWTLGKWSNGYGIRMNDELHSHHFTLMNIAIGKNEEVLAALYRGAIHEVLRVQITFG